MSATVKLTWYTFTPRPGAGTGPVQVAAHGHRCYTVRGGNLTVAMAGENVELEGYRLRSAANARAMAWELAQELADRAAERRAARS